MKLVKLPQALIDLVETADYLAEDDPEVADRFFDAFETTLEEIRNTPKIGSIRKFKASPIFGCGSSVGLRKVLSFTPKTQTKL